MVELHPGIACGAPGLMAMCRAGCARGDLHPDKVLICVRFTGMISVDHASTQQDVISTETLPTAQRRYHTCQQDMKSILCTTLTLSQLWTCSIGHTMTPTTAGQYEFPAFECYKLPSHGHAMSLSASQEVSTGMKYWLPMTRPMCMDWAKMM